METTGLAARQAAFGLLQDVLGRHRPFDEALAASPALTALEPRDRAFARLLAATVLRRLGQLDALIAGALARGVPAGAPGVADLLRLGLVQLLFLGTPPHAAVGTTVGLAERVGLRGFKGLVNAVLRRLGRDGPALVAGQDAARLNTPDWLWQSWSTAYGEAAARRIADMHLAEPPLDVSLKAGADPAEWAARLGAVLLPTGTLRRPAGGPIPELEGFAEGAWWVQDAAAALPVRLLGPVAGRRIADLCAAPGGKTMQLAAAGAAVTAVDRSAPRLDRLRHSLARLGLAAETLVADAAQVAAPEPFDGVLVDAPCSATGTIRRHPDVAHAKRPDDVARLAALQARLLDHAVTLVRPGGLIVWCTCSLQPEEGEAQVARLIASGAPVERVPVTPAELGGLDEAVTRDGEVRTLPFFLAEQGGMDGFHISRLRRLDSGRSEPA